MATVVLCLGSGMLLGSVLLLYWFFARPEHRPPAGISSLEIADFPRVAGLFEGIMMFAFGSFLFIMGLPWVLSRGNGG